MKLPGAREVTRLEAFSDGVFAFAATLLVVSLDVPGTIPELLADLSGFFAFGVSFAGLTLIWAVHHGFFKRFPLQDNWTVALNTCLLFVVVYYVYPLKFLSRTFARYALGVQEAAGSAPLVRGFGELRSLFVLYSVGFAAVFLFVALLYSNVWLRRRQLELDAQEAHEAGFHARHYLIFVLVGLLSVASAFSPGLRIGLPGWIYFLNGPLCYAHGVWSARRRPQSTP